LRRGGAAPGHDDRGFGRAWIPLFPRPADGEDAAEPTAFTVLLKTPETLASGKELHVLSRRRSVPALVEPASRWNVSGEVRDKLLESYPDTDFARCLVVEQYEPHHKADAAGFAAFLTWTAAVASLVGLVLGGVGLALWRARRKKPSAGI
jgi:hypothetical protein